MATKPKKKVLKSRWQDFKLAMSPRMRELQKSLWMIRGSPLSLVGLIIIVGLIVAALFASWITPYGPEERIWTDIRQGPSGIHWFGTDDSGGDIFSRVVWGAQISLNIGILVVVSAALLGSVVGVLSAYFRRWADEAIMRITDIFLAFPGLILAMAVASVLGRSIENVMLALVVVWWPAYARLVRSQALSVREQKYVEAARSVGAGDRRIVFRHILPNCLSPILVQATMDMGGVILTAAGLSFIGFGAQPGQAEWGRMVSEGQAYFVSYPWISFFPGMAIFVAVLGFNLFGDGLRDIIDPKLRSLVRRRL